jgi:hypothetical protein
MEAYFGGEDADYDAINKGQAQFWVQSLDTTLWLRFPATI